jgi:hypothetical protein
MKQVNKGASPAAFERWKALANDDWQPCPDDQAAIDMIALLQLDIAFLRNRRSEALTRVFDAAFLGTASDDELRTLATVYRQLDPDSGQHADFGHALALFAEALLPET